jgi:AcrR family transcriptional regulator
MASALDPDLAPRRRLLLRATDHVAEHGLADLTLRRIAASIGTSHRMLLYHFGSRDGLLIAVAGEVEQRQRQALADDFAATAYDPVETTRRSWARLSAPELAANERLFFELYGRALGGDPGATPMLAQVVDGWLDPLAHQLAAGGVDIGRDELRLGLAVVRGLLLDLLATGDRAGTTRALEVFLERYQ